MLTLFLQAFLTIESLIALKKQEFYIHKNVFNFFTLTSWVPENWKIS